MDIKYSKTKEVPVAEIIREEFSLVSTKPAGEYDRTFTDIELFVGEEYTVECDGTEYSCTAWEEDGKIHIGGKTEPFDIYRWESDIWAKGEGELKVTRETIVQDERVVGAADWDTLKNKPFGTKIEMVLAHKEYEVVEEEGIIAVALPFLHSKINSSKIYTVNYNGVNYECPVLVNYDTVDDITTEWYILGNTTILGGTTGAQIPFTIAIFDDGDSVLQIIDGSTPEKITLSIETETVTPLPAKFMPEPIVFTLAADMSTATCNKSYDECVEAVTKGNPLTIFRIVDAGVTSTGVIFTVTFDNDSNLINFAMSLGGASLNIIYTAENISVSFTE